MSMVVWSILDVHWKVIKVGSIIGASSRTSLTIKVLKR
jgi:hypothetical protein